MRAVRYAFAEALISLRRAGRSTLMSIGTVAVAFVTLGGFLLAAANLQRVVDRLGSVAEMSVFLRDDLNDGDRESLTRELAGHTAVARAAYVSKDQALVRFQQEFPELADVAAAGERNPFPPSIELELRPEAVAGGSADALAGELRQRAGVLDVRYDREWVARLVALVDSVRVAGAAIAGVLVLGAAFTVAAIVRLSLFARRDEIEIMRLVGAPYAYIRGPSVAEGVTIGGLGALAAIVILFALYQAFKSQLSAAALALDMAGELRFLGALDGLGMVLAAVALGGATGLLVARSIR